MRGWIEYPGIRRGTERKKIREKRDSVGGAAKGSARDHRRTLGWGEHFTRSCERRSGEKLKLYARERECERTPTLLHSISLCLSRERDREGERNSALEIAAIMDFN